MRVQPIMHMYIPMYNVHCTFQLKHTCILQVFNINLLGRCRFIYYTKVAQHFDVHRTRDADEIYYVIDFVEQ